MDIWYMSTSSGESSEAEEPANDGFFTPERVSRSDHGDKILENSENTTTSTNSLVHVPSPLVPRAIHVGAASIGSPVDPDPDVVAAAKMPGHPEVQQTRSFPNFPSEAQMDEGYDSDGFHDCCHEAIEEEGPQDFDEDELVAVPAGVALNVEPQQEEVDEDGAKFVDIPKADLDKMNVGSLKSELARRGVKAKGKKAELKARLIDALARSVKALPEGMVKARGNVLGGFAETAYWSQLKPRDAPISEPVNAFPGARAPTVPPDETEQIAAKFDFGELFERPNFAGTYQRNATNRNGRGKMDATGKPIQESAPLKYGCPNPAFIRKHGLTKESRPIDWFAAFMPRSREKKESHKFHIGQWCAWTNMKAQLMNAGQAGFLYPDFKPFSVEEIEMFLGLYIFNGLAPSPRVEFKFKTQQQDPVQGNDFIAGMFGSNSVRRLKHFKAFFSVQNPLIQPPSRKTNPNFKVDHFLTWIRTVGMTAWSLGETFSIDEQTIGFQGKHQDKLRITYKKEGDGFQCDALCQDGFTYSFYFRNHPAPKKYIDQGLSPLHSRVMALFDCVKFQKHRCGMDNLYMSAKFAKASFNHPHSILVAGVTRKGMRGLPSCVLQEEKSNKKDQMRVRGTVKAAILKGDPDCPDLVATSVYDTKPVHFLSMSCSSIRWIIKTRLVYCVDTQTTETLEFLRLNINDDYNGDMGHVDISDQLRNYYRFDHWMRKTKWWWSIMFWGLGIQLVNSYILYVKYKLSVGCKKKQLLSQYEFRRDIAMAWIDPATYWTHRDDSPQKKRRTSVDAHKAARKKARPPVRAVNEVIVAKQHRGQRISDSTLHPYTGALACRLYQHLPHFPVTPNTKRPPKCALHRWATGGEAYRAQVFGCDQCEVCLCLDCFKVFHSEVDIVGIKGDLNRKYSEALEAKRSRAKK
jgi:hypothetical protein